MTARPVLSASGRASWRKGLCLRDDGLAGEPARGRGGSVPGGQGAPADSGQSHSALGRGRRRRHRTAHSSSSRHPSAGHRAHRAFPYGSGRFPGWWWPRGAASELGADLASRQSRASEWTGDALAVGPMSGFAGASSPATCPAGLSSHPCPAAGVRVEVSPSSAAAFRPVDYFLKVLRFRR